MAVTRRAAEVSARWWASGRAALRQMSLRARLLLGLVVLAALGLFAADVVVYGALQAYLNGQVNNELATATSPGELHLAGCLGGSPAYVRGLPVGAAMEVVTSSGTRICSSPASFHLTGPPSVDGLQSGTAYDAVASGSVTGPFRVEAVNLGNGFVVLPGVIGLVAVPLEPIHATLHRLLLAELAVSFAVLVALGALGAVVVRVGMRPLRQMEETAAAIAAGDLSRRVENDDERTEVGRLGRSLNVMLATIEESFAQQQASEARLRRFLADASHELRTPVTSIRGYAELFRRGAAERPDDLALAMRRIEDEARRMGGLVEDLLLLARLDQGRPLERARVDLATIATDAAADAQVLDPDRPITMAVEPGVEVWGDEQRLRQVVGNLVQNALRHTPAATPVTVGVAAAGRSARLWVHDEGPGIPEEHAARIFERFYRADPSRTRNSGGSGLGLSIVASIAASHGGHARVDTALGRGSTFEVELPLAVDGAHGPVAGNGAQGPGAPGALGATDATGRANGIGRTAGSGEVEGLGVLEVGGVVEPPKDPATGGDDEDRDGGVVGPDEGEG